MSIRSEETVGLRKKNRYTSLRFLFLQLLSKYLNRIVSISEKNTRIPYISKNKYECMLICYHIYLYQVCRYNHNLLVKSA